jgi:hypothetical protein
VVIAAGACLSDPPCAIALGVATAAAAVMTLPVIQQMAKDKGKTGVADTGIFAEATEMVRKKFSKDICDALKKLYDSSSGVKRNKIKATQKAKGCEDTDKECCPGKMRKRYVKKQVVRCRTDC